MAGSTTDYSERRLDRAVQHVSAHWFPINPEVLASVRKGLESGAYDMDVSFLIQELKSDFALFTYCIRELLKVGLAEHVPYTVLSDPLTLLRWGGVARIKKVLCSDRQPPQTHSLTAHESLLHERLRNTAIAATTAEVLGERRGVDGDIAFCHGVVRQVGLNLIAWNYPALYARVIRSLTPRSTLDDELSKELGFSPAILAMKLLRPQVDDSPRYQSITSAWKVYDHLCEVGEALARASAPETYPSASQEWTKASEFIKDTIGLDGMELIRRRAVENTYQYREVLPATFGSLGRLDPESAISIVHRKSRARNNPYIERCPEHVRAALMEVYADMPSSSVDRAAVERLVKHVIPRAGFSGGCVFVVDPAAMSLMPRTLIGKVAGRTLGRVALKSAPGPAMAALVTEHIADGAKLHTDLAAAAFNCEQPLVERHDGALYGSETSSAGIYSCLGKKRKIGVLYLELPQEDLDKSDSRALMSFKAVRQALCDALLVE